MVDRDIILRSRRVMVGRAERDVTAPRRADERIHDRPVFSRGEALTSHPFGRGGRLEFSYRTTDRDKAPAREVLTPILMGDPAPDRVTDHESPDRRHGRQKFYLNGRRCTESGPILLTFKEYREYYGDSA